MVHCFRFLICEYLVLYSATILLGSYYSISPVSSRILDRLITLQLHEQDVLIVEPVVPYNDSKKKEPPKARPADLMQSLNKTSKHQKYTFNEEKVFSLSLFFFFKAPRPRFPHSSPRLVSTRRQLYQSPGLGRYPMDRGRRRRRLHRLARALCPCPGCWLIFL
jgi:hypothetical protein